MARADPRSLDRLVERFLDLEPADWPPHDPARGEDTREAEALRTLADIAQAFRRFDAAPSEPALFQWGTIAVQSKVADGGSSEVYRAWDAGLGLAVALKLLRTGADAPRAGEFLAEARRLARVRHRNVLSVYGAAVHDGRAGLWSEWIDGESLAQRVARDGTLGAEETAVVGIALCRALAAVHGAGLLHGDVKPDNVLRERGGRIVLADLGAGGEPAAVNAGLRSAASPAWLAPEVLHGALRTPQHDLYALGGVLQFLLDGRRPDPAKAGADFVRRDVPPALCAVVARARAADPAARYADAGEMERDLAAYLADERVPRDAAISSRRRGLALAGGVALAAVLALGLWWRASPPVPPEAELGLLRHRGGVTEAIADGVPVALGDGLSFTLRGARPLWLYAYNADDRGVLQRLFPLRELDTGNPLPPGRPVEIPGYWRGRAMRFEVSSGAAAEEFLVVAAAAPVARLEALEDEVAVAAAEVRARGTALVVPATAGLSGTRLGALADELAATESGLRLWRYRLPHERSELPSR